MTSSAEQLIARLAEARAKEEASREAWLSAQNAASIAQSEYAARRKEAELAMDEIMSATQPA